MKLSKINFTPFIIWSREAILTIINCYKRDDNFERFFEQNYVGTSKPISYLKTTML